MKRCLRLIALMLVAFSFNLIVPKVKAASALGDVNADGHDAPDQTLGHSAGQGVEESHNYLRNILTRGEMGYHLAPVVFT